MICWNGYTVSSRPSSRADPLDLIQSDLDSELAADISDDDCEDFIYPTEIIPNSIYQHIPRELKKNYLRNILTLNGTSKRAQRILKEAPYPHPEFHYSEVPVNIAELQNLGHDYNRIVKEVQQIPHSAFQPVKDDQNRRMVDVDEFVNIGVKLARLPTLADF
jgi:hypothetical protein